MDAKALIMQPVGVVTINPDVSWRIWVLASSSHNSSSVVPVHGAILGNVAIPGSDVPVWAGDSNVRNADSIIAASRDGKILGPSATKAVVVWEIGVVKGVFVDDCFATL